MKFGIFDHVERRRDVPLDQQYKERIELLVQADRSGIYGYHVAEHHHSPLSMAPSQTPYLSAIAARTENIRFGPLVYVLPLYHPIRLVEEICMLDNISGGRFQIGIGPGAPPGEELAMWGGDPSEYQERFNESFQILMQGLTRDFVDFQGQFFNIKDLWMELKTKQKPHPPFWYAGNPVNAARYGANFIGAGPNSSIPNTIETYLETLQKQAEENDPSLPHVKEPLYGASKRMFIAETDDEALSRAREAYEVYRANFVKPLPGGKSRRPTAAFDVPGRVGPPSPWDATFDEALQDEAVLVGSPDTAKEYVHRYSEQSKCNYLVTPVQWGDLTHEEATRSLELFATEVIPDFAS